MSSNNTIETSQITTGLGQDAYNTFDNTFIVTTQMITEHRFLC